MYKVYLDKNKNFECDIKIDGAELKNSKIFLVLESEDFQIRFKGDIGYEGKVNIPIPKLKSVLKENSSGKMFLEVVADDTYFIPYTTDYSTENQLKVETVIKEQTIEKKPMATVLFPKTSLDLVEHLLENGISAANISKNKKKLIEHLTTFFVENSVKKEDQKKMLKELPELLY